MLGILGKFLTERISNDGYLAVFVLMLLGSACIPIPSEVVMAFGGALASGTFADRVLGDPGAALGLVPVMVVGVVASLLGSWLAWWVGYTGGRPLIDRFGRYLLLRPHEVDRAHEWFERHGEAAVFFARLIPLIRAFISLPAGVARMGFGRFTIYTFLGILPWTVGLALAGYALGERWSTVERLMGPVSLAVGVVALAALGWWVRRSLHARASGGLSSQNGQSS
ncbi:MAG: DedA family protein [Actinobacteria bacterium]|nr:DedA family protein [Actinomycetota bacterium]